MVFANLAREAPMNLEYGVSQEGLSPQERAAFELAVRHRRKNVWLAYVLLLALGFVGAHKFYLRQKGMGFLYAFTFGLLIIGVIVDATRLEDRVHSYNDQIEHDTLQRILAQRARGTQPA